MPYVVAPLEDSDSGDLVVTEDRSKVANEISDAVNRIGAWKGNIYGAWEVEARCNPAVAEEIVQGKRPDSLWMFSSNSNLLRLDDENLDRVQGSL